MGRNTAIAGIYEMPPGRYPDLNSIEMYFFMAQQELSSTTPEGDEKRDDRRPRSDEQGDDLFRR